jgi:hypothetical protein
MHRILHRPTSSIPESFNPSIPHPSIAYASNPSFPSLNLPSCLGDLVPWCPIPYRRTAVQVARKKNACQTHFQLPLQLRHRKNAGYPPPRPRIADTDSQSITSKRLWQRLSSLDLHPPNQPPRTSRLDSRLRTHAPTGLRAKSTPAMPSAVMTMTRVAGRWSAGRSFGC